jgi:hypothetical protein
MMSADAVPAEEPSDKPITLQRTATLAEKLMAAPGPVLASLEAIRDPTDFARAMGALEDAIRKLASLSQAAVLLEIVKTLDRIAGHQSWTPGTREGVAAKAARTLHDPRLLRSVAEEALSGEGVASDAAKELLSYLGLAGAHASCAARVHSESRSTTRRRFVGLMVEQGGRSWPAVRAALDTLLSPFRSGPLDVALLEDLLRAVPDVVDEPMGTLVAPLVRHENHAVARAAVVAVANLWGPRARPLLLGVLDSASEGVRLASLAAFRKIGGLDDHVVRRIERILARPSNASDELRAASASALAEVGPISRAQAIELLQRSLAPPKGGLLSKLRAAPDHESAPLVLVSAARSLLVLEGRAAHAAIEERASKSDESLQAQLLALVKDA